MRSTTVRRILACIVTLLLFHASGMTAARAHTDGSGSEESNPGPTIPPGAVTIGDNYAFNGGVISTADKEGVRTFDAYHAAVYVQSWLGEAFFGTPKLEEPPADLPVSRVDISGQWGNQIGRVTSYYASDGTTVWLALPTGVTPQQDSEAIPPASNWFIPDPRVKDAFEGTADLIPTAALEPTTSTLPDSASKPASSSSKSSSNTLGIIALIALAVIVAAFIVVRRRSNRDERELEMHHSR